MPTAAESQRQSPIWGVTSYFNFEAYGTKLENFRKFRASLRRQGLPLIAVEAALPNRQFELTSEDADILVQRRASAVLWQKERLLNIGIEALPRTCTHVVWMDNDGVFADDQWIPKTLDLLERYAVVQPFGELRRLERGCLPPAPGEPEPPTEYIYNGAVHQAEIDGAMTRILGAPGFAIAARRDLLRSCPLYDKMILGGADALMLGAFMGIPIDRIDYITFLPDALRADAEAWWQTMQRLVGGSVSCLREKAYHLWHGSRSNRHYHHRQWLLRDFDPKTDICLDDEGCWQWSSAKPDLHAAVRGYFQARQEDPSEPDRQLTENIVTEAADTGSAFRMSVDWFSRKIPLWEKHLATLSGRPCLHYLEVGTWEGRSLCWMLKNVLTHPTARATCIDLFPEKPQGHFQTLAEKGAFSPTLHTEACLDHNLGTLGASHKVRKIRGASHDILPTLVENRYDIVYIDADHMAHNVLLDGIYAWKLLKPGGILIFDDYDLARFEDERLNPRQGIDAFLSVYAPYLTVLHDKIQVWIRKERSDLPTWTNAESNSSEG